MCGVAPSELVSLTIRSSSASISSCRVKTASPVLSTCRRTASSTTSDQSRPAMLGSPPRQWQTSRMANDSKRYAMVCSHCGSDEVSRDAWADWDTGKQEWVLGAVFDYAHCHK